MRLVLCLLFAVTAQAACGQNVTFVQDVAVRLNKERVQHRQKHGLRCVVFGDPVK
jgi:hypothetical protein